MISLFFRKPMLKKPGWTWLWLLPLGFMALFYVYPLGTIAWLAFQRSGGAVSWQQVFSPYIGRVLGFTVSQALLSTLLTLLVGLPGAYLLGRYDFRGKGLLRALTGIPFVLPTLVVAAGFNALLGPRGWVNLALMNGLGLQQPPLVFINTFFAILVAHVFYNLTIVLRLVGDYWSHLDEHTSQAARLLGATRWQAFRTVTLPLLSPAILAAALLVFIFDFTSFGVILVLGGPRFATLEVEIYYQTSALFNLPVAVILSLLQLTCTLGLTVLYARLSARLVPSGRLTVARLVQRRFSGTRQRLLAGSLIAFLLLLQVTPLLALAGRSFLRSGPERGQAATNSTVITLANYQELWANRRSALFYASPLKAMLISLGYATATVLMAVGLGLPAAWSLAREPADLSPAGLWLNRFVDPLLMLPLGTSAVTLGLGFLVSLNRAPLDLRASPILIPIAHTLVAFPFVVRSLTPALRSIRKQLRQAAAMLGASPGQVFQKIDLPLAGRAVLVAGVFAFSISIGEFGATALLARPELPTLPVVIYRFLSQPGALNYGQALAMSTILMLVTAGGMLAIERLRIAEVGEF